MHVGAHQVTVVSDDVDTVIRNDLLGLSNDPSKQVGPHWARGNQRSSQSRAAEIFFLARARCLSAGLRYLRLTRLPRHDRGPVPGGNRSAASCLCTVLRRALYHYATRSPQSRAAESRKSALQANPGQSTNQRGKGEAKKGSKETQQGRRTKGRQERGPPHRPRDGEEPRRGERGREASRQPIPGRQHTARLVVVRFGGCRAVKHRQLRCSYAKKPHQTNTELAIWKLITL